MPLKNGVGGFAGTQVNSQPLLYMKGIHQRELEAVLNFMYHGEVNVAQDALNAFLAVAEELAVKGLTTESKNEETSRAPSTHNRLVGTGIGMTELGPDEFGEADSEFTSTKKGHSLKRISFGGEKGSIKKSPGFGQGDREKVNSNSQHRTGVKKRLSEGAIPESSVEAKRVKSDPDSIQIGEATSLAGTDHPSSSGPGEVDPGEFVDEGSGDPEFEDNYGYTEGDLDETGGATSGGDATKGKSSYQNSNALYISTF